MKRNYLLTGILVMAAFAAGTFYQWPQAEAQVGGTWTYAQVITELQVRAAKITAQRQNLARGYALIELADTELGNMSTDSASLATAISNAPANDTYNPIKTQWAALVAEFQALKTTSAAQKAALDAL